MLRVNLSTDDAKIVSQQEIYPIGIRKYTEHHLILIINNLNHKCQIMEEWLANNR